MSQIFRTLRATNQDFQYLYSVVTDANVETIQKIRTAISIMDRTFNIVNAYELEKAGPMKQVKAIDKQIEMIIQAGKEEAQADQLDELKNKREQIVKGTVTTLSKCNVSVEIPDEEIDFIMNEMTSFLFEAKKMNASEMGTFDSVYTALEAAKAWEGFMQETCEPSQIPSEEPVDA